MFNSGGDKAFKELGVKDWDKIIKKEESVLTIIGESTKNSKNHTIDFKIATKNSKIKVPRMRRNKEKRLVATEEVINLIMEKEEDRLTKLRR